MTREEKLGYISNSVLLLGSYRFPHVRKLFRELSFHFLRHGLLPIVLEESWNITQEGANVAAMVRELYQKGWTPRQVLHFLLGLVKFAVVDDTVPSGAIIEMGYARNSGTLVVVLRGRREGNKNGGGDLVGSSWMTLDFTLSNDFILMEYDVKEKTEGDRIIEMEPDVDDIKKVVDEMIDLVHRRLEERRVTFENLSRRYVCGLDEFERCDYQGRE